jgi:small subunit ribosomal protein S8
MLTDPISDMLTRIRNAMLVNHDVVLVPASKMRVSIVEILKRERFIRNFEKLRGEPQGILRIHLAYRDKGESAISGLKRISKPGLRVYVGNGEIPRVFGGLGISILSTSQGMMTGQEAWRSKIGGELLCYVW